MNIEGRASLIKLAILAYGGDRILGLHNYLCISAKICVLFDLFFFPFTNLMEEFKPKEAVNAVAVLARQGKGSRYSQETVGGVAFHIYADSFGAKCRIPLMDVMAGRTGNVSGIDRFSGLCVKKRKMIWVSFNISFQDNNFFFGVGGYFGYFILSRPICRVAGMTHLCHNIAVAVKITGPQLEFVFTVVNKMADTAHPGLGGCLADDVFRSGRCYY